MKLELSQREAQEAFGKVLKSYLGELVGDRVVSNVEFKTYPTNHVVITLDKPGEDE